MLFLLAAEESSNFGYGSEEERKSIVFLDGEQYLGYLFWSKRADRQRAPVLHQLFLREQFRGKGLGTAVVRTWIEQVALPLSASFGVESPNARTQSILVGLGYAYFKDKAIIGRNCFFVPSM
jgi:GNAT superfamily N-acetyltransferase